MLIRIIRKTARFFIPGLLACGLSLSPLQAEETYISESQKIFDVIDRWAEAWINLDAETYIAYYTKNYRPDDNTSHRNWAADRRHRFAVQKWIKIGITNMVISKRDDEHYSVTFKQRYKSDSFRDTVRKELIFVKENAQWRIQSERVLGH